MNNPTKLAIASVALTVALAANTPQPAAAALGRPNTPNATRVMSSHPSWTVVRVSVSNRGDVEGMRITYQSGDKSFDRTALQAVSKTTFASISEPAKASTFDYLLMTDARGKRTARIMAALPGDAHVSPTATVAVREKNPWTSRDVVACSI